MKLSIITNTHGHLNILKNCLPDMIDYCGVETEVIINDNGSDEETLTWLFRSLPKKIDSQNILLKILKQPTNIGNPQGINCALSHAKGEYIAKIDPDFIMPKGWAAQAIELIESLPVRIGIVGFHWARGLEKDPTLRKGDLHKTRDLIYFTPIKVFGVWVFKAEIINEVGCFMDDLSMYGCWDTEFQARLRMNGYTNIYARHDSIHCGSGHDTQEHREWKNQQAKLASEKLNQRGALKYWMNSLNFDHRKFQSNHPAHGSDKTISEKADG